MESDKQDCFAIGHFHSGVSCTYKLLYLNEAHSFKFSSHPLGNTPGNQTPPSRLVFLPECFVTRNGDANYFPSNEICISFCFQRNPLDEQEFPAGRLCKNMHDYEVLSY
jgi:hypothetical protein